MCTLDFTRKSKHTVVCVCLAVCVRVCVCVSTYLFSLSSTASSARLISSIRIISPLLIAVTSGPSTHVNGAQAAPHASCAAAASARSAASSARQSRAAAPAAGGCHACASTQCESWDMAVWSWAWVVEMSLGDGWSGTSRHIYGTHIYKHMQEYRQAKSTKTKEHAGPTSITMSSLLPAEMDEGPAHATHASQRVGNYRSCLPSRPAARCVRVRVCVCVCLPVSKLGGVMPAAAQSVCVAMRCMTDINCPTALSRPLRT